MRCVSVFVVKVLVSIQSLILVPQPYFNEPGYEARGNMAESKRYNEVRTGATSSSRPRVYWRALVEWAGSVAACGWWHRCDNSD